MKKVVIIVVAILMALTLPIFAKDIEIDSFNDALLDSLERPAIFTFGEAWCQPCLKMISVLEKLADSDPGVDIYYVDISKVPEATEIVPVMATPTTAFYLKGGVPFMPENNRGQYLIYALRESGEPVLTTRIGYLDEKTLTSIIAEMT